MDAVSVAANIMLFIIAWALLGWAVCRNFRDAHRAKDLRAQMVTIKDEHKTQIANLTTRLSSEKARESMPTQPLDPNRTAMNADDGPSHSLATVDPDKWRMAEDKFSRLKVWEKMALKIYLLDRRASEHYIGQKIEEDLGLVAPRGEIFNTLNNKTPFMDRDYVGSNGIRPEYENIVRELLKRPIL